MRALISVYDKTGIVSFAKGLVQQGWEIISTGGTAKTLQEANIPVIDVASVTGFPEILDGRVKTLHPKIHAGILAKRSDPKQMATLREEGIEPIDMVVVNFYPFAQTPKMENIDVGGPTMIRAAAKNYEEVLVVVDPADYENVLSVIARRPSADEAISPDFRKQLAAKAFARTAEYEQAIAGYFPLPFVRGGKGGVETLPPLGPLLTKEGRKLRYGENPHQKASFYQIEGQPLDWDEPLQGKALSYNNILDADAALQLIREFFTTRDEGRGTRDEFACAIIKHTNPCGVAVSAQSLAGAFAKAIGCDPVSAFGGIVAFNNEVDKESAEKLSGMFLEVILAPSFSKAAQDILAKKKNLRLLEVLLSHYRTIAPSHQYRSAGGGLLVQTRDEGRGTKDEWKVVTQRKPTSEEQKALWFAWKVVKHVKSNAIVFAAADRTLGIGAGQTSRVDAVKVAIMKMNQQVNQNTRVPAYQSTVVASDAFFPFPDGVEEAAAAGATAVIQPGGSVKDQEIIATADRLKLTMVFTSVRHFRH